MSNISRWKRNSVLARDDYTCLKCGIRIPPEIKIMPNPEKKLWILEIDHIIPLSVGGNNDITNLQTLCNRCNCRKHCTMNSPFMIGKKIIYKQFK